MNPIEPDLLKPEEKKKEMKSESSFKKIRIILMVLILFALTKEGWKVIQTMNPAEGILKAKEETELDLPFDGVLSKLNVENSQKVREGDTLFIFENVDLEQSLMSALREKESLCAALGYAEREALFSSKRLQSARVLYENEVISKEALEQIELNDSGIQLTLAAKRREFEEKSLLTETLQAKGDSLIVKAPMDGIFLGDFQSRLNTRFQQGDSLGLIFSPRAFILEIEVPEERVRKIKLGDHAKVRIKSVPGMWDATVDRIDAHITQAIEKVYKTKYISRVLLELTQTHPDFIPGMRGSARLVPSLRNQFTNQEVPQ